MKLTKDDFSTNKWFFGIQCDDIMMEQILKNQEIVEQLRKYKPSEHNGKCWFDNVIDDAEKWNKLKKQPRFSFELDKPLDEQIARNSKIVERLKKRIDELKRNGSDWGTTAPVLIKELQKILEGE